MAMDGVAARALDAGVAGQCSDAVKAHQRSQPDRRIVQRAHQSIARREVPQYSFSKFFGVYS